jgi:hypothetical protein
MIFYDNRHIPEVEEWYYRMMHEPNQWEKFRFRDAIYDYENIIAELEKLYEITPTSDHYMRARIQSELKEAKRELTKTMAEYDEFKEYKASTAISK